MLNLLLIYLIYLISCSTNLVLCSEGDKHYIYQSCLHHCQQINCSTSSGLNSFHLKQSVFEQLTFWSCPDECAYQCMWKTVNHMQKNEKRVAQFHGKWPFIRLFGIQEPASTLFSIANFISHYYYGFRVIRKRLQYRVHPLYNVWLCFSIVALNAWIWSAIFHTRDKPFTEKMDYICAIALIFYQYFCCITRICYTNQRRSTMFTYVHRFLTFLLFTFFLYHSYYLLFVQMDYGYNMLVNISVGIVNVLFWLFWCLRHSHLRYVWRCTICVILTLCFACLELLDFEPIAWIIDAHSLWHFSTIILPLLWYQFVIDDSNYLLGAPYH